MARHNTYDDDDGDGDGDDDDRDDERDHTGSSRGAAWTWPGSFHYFTCQRHLSFHWMDQGKEKESNCGFIRA